MRIDANLALALCCARYRLLGLPIPGVERTDRIETVSFQIDDRNKAVLLWDNHGDLGFVHKAGVDWSPRDLTSATSFADFMHAFDGILLETRPDAGSALALGNELARRMDMRVLDEVLLDPDAATTQDMNERLARCAELAPEVAPAVEAYLDGAGPSADGDLSAWHDRIDEWLSEGRAPDPIPIEDCTARRIVTRVGLTTAAYRAGSSIDVVLQAVRPPGLRQRLREVLQRRPSEMLPDHVEIYEIRRPGVAGSVLVRMGENGRPSEIWKPSGCAIPSHVVEGLAPSGAAPGI